MSQSSLTVSVGWRGSRAKGIGRPAPGSPKVGPHALHDLACWPEPGRRFGPNRSCVPAGWSVATCGARTLRRGPGFHLSDCPLPMVPPRGGLRSIGAAVYQTVPQLWPRSWKRVRGLVILASRSDSSVTRPIDGRACFRATAFWQRTERSRRRGGAIDLPLLDVFQLPPGRAGAELHGLREGRVSVNPAAHRRAMNAKAVGELGIGQIGHREHLGLLWGAQPVAPMLQDALEHYPLKIQGGTVTV